MSAAVDTLFGQRPGLRRNDAEAKLQAQVMNYLHWALPANAVPHHSPNEGLRSPRARQLLKASGCQAGWPDIEIAWGGPPPRVIYIELKAPKGTLSPEQRDLHNRLFYCGHEVIVCRSVECVEESLRELGVPLRASLGRQP